MQSQLEKQITYFDSVILSLREGVVLVNQDFKIIFHNDTFSNMAGRIGDSFIGRSLFEFLPLKTEQNLNIEMVGGLNGEHNLQVGNFESAVEVNALYISELKIGVILLVDLVGRKREEETFLHRAMEIEVAKQRAEQDKVKDEAVLRSIGNGLIATDENNNIIIFNQSASDLLGWSFDEAVAKPLFEVARVTTTDQDEDDVEVPASKSILEVLNPGSSVITTYYLIRKDKTRFPADITTSSVILDKKIIGTVLVFRDITIERQAEQAKSDFLAIASHQLRTPLGSMRWSMEMILSGDFGVISQEAKTALTTVLENNQRMINLVNDLLSVSKIDQGRLTSSPEEVLLSNVVLEAINEVSILAKAKNLKINNELEGNEYKVFVDKKQLREAVENLLSNAIKYNIADGKFSMSVLPPDEDGFITFKVADTGMGISQGDQKNIFRKFFRGANAIHKETEGSGLGLYVVKSYVQRWGGKIWFESDLDKGAIFYITIPTKKQ